MRTFIPNVTSTCVDGAVFFLMGEPFVGKSHILASIKGACDSVGQRVSIYGKIPPVEKEEMRSLLLDRVYKARLDQSKAIFVEGYPRSKEHAKILYDLGLVGGSTGYIVRVTAPRAVILNRAYKEQLDKDEVSSEIDKYSSEWVKIVQWAESLNIRSNLFQVDNSSDPGMAAARLAKFSALDQKYKKRR